MGVNAYHNSSVELYIIYGHIFTLHISQFCIQRTLQNQPAELIWKQKNVKQTLKKHAWSDSAIAVCFVLDIYVQNHTIYWSDEGRDFKGIPFIIER